MSVRSLPRRPAATPRRRDSWFPVVGSVVASGAGIATTAVVARALPPADFAIYGVTLSLVVFVGAAAVAGADLALPRFMAATAGVRGGRVRLQWRRYALRSAVIGSAVFLPVALAYERVGAGAPSASGVLGGMLATATLAFITIAREPYRGRHELRRYALLGQVLPAVAAFLAATALLATVASPTANVALTGVAAGQAGAILVVLLQQRRTASHADAVVRPPLEYRRTWAFGAQALLLLLSASIDLWVAGVFADPVSVAAYAVASRGVVVLGLPIAGVGSSAAARLAAPRLRARGLLDWDLRRLIRWSFALTVGAYGLSFLVAPTLIGALFGDLYAEPGARLFWVLGAGQLVNAATGPVGLALQMQGFENRVVVTNGAVIALVLLGMLVVAPTYGVTGLALVATVGNMLRNVVYTVDARRVGCPRTDVFAGSWRWAA